MKSGIKHANKLFNKGLYDKALKIYEETIQMFANDEIVLHGYADTLSKMRRYEEALKIYEKVVEISPDNVIPRIGLAHTLTRLGQIKEALDIYKKTVEIFPHDVVARNGLAATLRRMGMFNDALKEYQQSVEIFPQDRVSLIGLADCLLRLDRYDEAVKVYGEIIQMFPTDRTARINFAETLKKMGRHREAEQITTDKAAEFTIVRSIEFTEEYYQAGMSILGYFRKVLSQKYPDTKVKVRIEQEDLIVRMIIETPEGKKDAIEKTLEEYGLVVIGEIAAEDFLSDPIQAIELKQQVQLARFQLENQKELLKFAEKQYGQRIDSLENEISWLRSHIGNVLIYSENQSAEIRNTIGYMLDLVKEQQNEIIESQVNILIKKIGEGIKDSDEGDIKQALKKIQNEDQKTLNKLIGILNELIIKGAIAGVSGNLLYQWLKYFIL